MKIGISKVCLCFFLCSDLASVTLAVTDEEKEAEAHAADVLAQSITTTISSINKNIKNGTIYLIPVAVVNLPVSAEVASASKSISSASSAVSAVSAGGVSATQASRTLSVSTLVKCQGLSVADYEEQSAGWDISNPFMLAPGNSVLSNEVGTVVSSNAMLGGLALIFAGLSYLKGAKAFRFPGLILIPELILSTQATTSAVVLVRKGSTLQQQALGVASLALHAFGPALAAVPLIPSNFKATWNSETKKWIDTIDEGSYVKKYGTLFKDYREGRTAFIVVELLMNLASGTVTGFTPEQANCRELGWVAVGVYGSYTLLYLILMPSTNMVDKIYFPFIASAQTSSLLINAAMPETDNSDSKQSGTANYIAGTIPLAVNTIIFVRSLYDLAVLLRDIAKWMHKMREPMDMLDSKSVTLLTVPTNKQFTSNPLLNAQNSELASIL